METGRKARGKHSTFKDKENAVLFVKSMCEMKRSVTDHDVYHKYGVSRTVTKLFDAGVIVKSSSGYRHHYDWVTSDIHEVIKVIFSRGISPEDDAEQVVEQASDSGGEGSPIGYTATVELDDLDKVIEDGLGLATKYGVTNLGVYLAEYIRSRYNVLA